MTAVTPDVDVDLDDITHLDLTPTCDTAKCEAEASWIVTWRVPTPFCCPSLALMCHGHFTAVRIGLRTNAFVICDHAIILGRARDVLTRIEPL